MLVLLFNLIIFLQQKVAKIENGSPKKNKSKGRKEIRQFDPEKLAQETKVCYY